MNRKPEYNTITFDLNLYDSEADMMQDVFNVISILVKNENVVLFRYEDCGIYVLEFEHNERCADPYGCDNPRWITDDEWEEVLIQRYDHYERYEPKWIFDDASEDASSQRSGDNNDTAI